jgi:tetratricopeptide (TPR) repeat protein
VRHRCGAPSAIAIVVALTAILGAPRSVRSQDFDPAGRRQRRPIPAPVAGPRPTPSSVPADRAPAPVAALIARYTAIALAQPGSPFPVQRLAQLYRERDGNLRQLVAEFEKRAADSAADQWPATIVLGAIYQQDGRLDEAVKAYENARARRPKNAVPLVALAHLAQDRGDLAIARARYDEALPLVAPHEREPTERALMLLALDLKDFEGARTYHKDLVKRSLGSDRKSVV